eukprot:243967-Pyramimonas_sp.AAC.1
MFYHLCQKSLLLLGNSFFLCRSLLTLYSIVLGGASSRSPFRSLRAAAPGQRVQAVLLWAPVDREKLSRTSSRRTVDAGC